jgi:Zn-dependent protease
MGTGMAITAGAGPLSNVVLAVVTAVAFGLLARFAPGTLRYGGGVRELLDALLRVNVALALFNLIPIPPLDGSRIVDGFLPYRFRPAWERVTALAPFLLVGVFVLGWRVIAYPASILFGLLADLIHVIAA